MFIPVKSTFNYYLLVCCNKHKMTLHRSICVMSAGDIVAPKEQNETAFGSLES